MDLVTKHLLHQPEPVQKTLLNRIKSSIFPFKTDKKAPDVQTNTRGRPKNDQPRNSSYSRVDQQEQFTEPPRHSISIMGSQTSQVSQPPRHSMSSKGKAKKPKNTFNPGDEEKNNFLRFSPWIPDVFKPYIVGTQDVRPDGNCGFRSIAVGLGLNENEWPYIRKSLIDELYEHAAEYQLFFPDIYIIRDRLEWFDYGGTAPMDKWMEIPTGLVLAANRFNCIIRYIAHGSSGTYFPFFISPREISDHRIITIAFVNNNHFIKVDLTDDSPMPNPGFLWKHYSAQPAKEWETFYMSRIKLYRDLMGPNDPEFIPLA